MTTKKETWQDLAKSKRDSINNSIPTAWRISSIPSAVEQRDVTGKYVHQFLSAREVEITETDAVDIAEKTSCGQWTAEEVIKAFCHRASLAHQLTNCLHETFFDAAVQSAKELDEYYAKHKAPIGPLHGLPVSLKDQFHVKGVETTMGYVGWMGTFQGKKGTGREKVFESEMVIELRKAGAVLYCKTSVPHTLMSGETVNNIIGYTWNSKNRHLSAGGSSGGEGALIGLKGSPVGFGTDIGGSIRIPAAFNGLYGIRPSSGRLPYEGMANSMDGQNSVLSVVGPLSHSAASLRLLIKSLLSQQPWLHDPLVCEMPWRDDHEKQIQDLIHGSQGDKPKLAFGFMKHDGAVTPHPPVQRAMDIAVMALAKLGHKACFVGARPEAPSLIAFRSLNGNHRRISVGTRLLLLKSWKYDGGENVHEAFSLSGEPLAHQLAAAYGDKPFEQMKASQIAENNVAKREYQKEYMEYWNSTEALTGTGRPVDALIIPVAPFSAPRPSKYTYYGYSTIFNVLDYTSCTIPITYADQNVDVIAKDFKPISDHDKAVAEGYDPAIYDGAHVSLQLVGRRLQEEKVLALTEHLGNAIWASK